MLASMRVIGWPIGLVGLVMSSALFGLSGLYADMFLQLILIISFVYGWYSWSSQSSHNSNGDFEVLFLSLKGWVLSVATIAILSGAVFYVLVRFTDSTTPILDAFTSVSSIVCVYLSSKKYIDNWIMWIVIDSLYVFLYVHKNIYFAAFTTLVYLVIAVYGYKHWKKNYSKQKV
jgi:nicotinamide mononucleotide transporter